MLVQYCWCITFATATFTHFHHYSHLLSFTLINSHCPNHVSVTFVQMTCFVADFHGLIILMARLLTAVEFRRLFSAFRCWTWIRSRYIIHDWILQLSCSKQIKNCTVFVNICYIAYICNFITVRIQSDSGTRIGHHSAKYFSNSMHWNCGWAWNELLRCVEISWDAISLRSPLNCAQL